MSFEPIRSYTEDIVEKRAGYMEFDLTKDAGYGRWLGMFEELGRMGKLFNGYMIHTSQGAMHISRTPVELHLFNGGLYVAPPFEYEEYYIEIKRPNVRLGRVYYRIPPSMPNEDLKGHKPDLNDMLAIDIWSETDSGAGQSIYTLYFEAIIVTEADEYRFFRFTREQLSKFQGHEGGVQ